jgi:hypothetical protein
MPKPADDERRIILSGDERRKYSVRLRFEVERSSFMGEINQVVMLLDNGKNATLGRSKAGSQGEIKSLYFLDIDGFSSATEAERYGMVAAQSLLISAVSLNFGLRLIYDSHEPPAVIDKTMSRKGGTYFEIEVESYNGWTGEAITAELIKTISHSLRDRRMLLALELYASSLVEQNTRSKFLLTVSAFEPLAQQEDLGPEVRSFVTRLCSELDADLSIPGNLRSSLRGRIQRLQEESVRQALKRLCAKWFPDDPNAKKTIDYVYGLRSDILHEGRLKDLDVDLNYECKVAAKYLRLIFQKEFDMVLRVPVV